MAMKRGRYSEAQIVGILKEHEAGRKVAELAREHVVRWHGGRRGAAAEKSGRGEPRIEAAGRRFVLFRD